MAINIGRSIRIARGDQRMTNVIIGERLGVHPNTVSRMCRSHTAHSETIEKLARIFGMSVADFISLGESQDEASHEGR